MTRDADQRVMAPSRAYAEGVEKGRWSEDPAQRSALVQFDRIHQELLQRRPTLLNKLLVGLRAPGVVIQDPGCVAKTFPKFFDVLAGITRP